MYRYSRYRSRLLQKLGEYNTNVTGDSDRLSSSESPSEDLLHWCLSNSLTEMFQPLPERGVREERLSTFSQPGMCTNGLLKRELTKCDGIFCSPIPHPNPLDIPQSVAKLPIEEAIDPDTRNQHSHLSFPLDRRRKTKRSLGHVDIDDCDLGGHNTCGTNESLRITRLTANPPYGSPRTTSSGQPMGALAENALSGFDAVIDLALSSEEASSFDLPELHEAFLKFFEEGTVSDELDGYFTKVLESEGLHCFSTANGTKSNRAKKAAITDSVRRSAADQRWLDKRIRNNEASRRCRAARKANFQRILEHLEQLRCEKRELCIWIREIRSAIREAKLALVDPGVGPSCNVTPR